MKEFIFSVGAITFFGGLGMISPGLLVAALGAFVVWCVVEFWERS